MNAAFEQCLMLFVVVSVQQLSGSHSKSMQKCGSNEQCIGSSFFIVLHAKMQRTDYNWVQARTKHIWGAEVIFCLPRWLLFGLDYWGCSVVEDRFCKHGNCACDVSDSHGKETARTGVPHLCGFCVEGDDLPFSSSLLGLCKTKSVRVSSRKPRNLSWPLVSD